MSDTNTKFIRKYKRVSKSIWEKDDSTILLYSDVVLKNEDDIELSFTHYIYIHRDNVGKVLGISISRAMLEENPSFTERYLEGIDMYGFLLMHIDAITEFCTLFTDEFESIFMLKPCDYFEAAELHWFSIIENS